MHHCRAKNLVRIDGHLLDEPLDHRIKDINTSRTRMVIERLSAEIGQRRDQTRTL